jgi:very-short-patch-repair endonuclease
MPKTFKPSLETMFLSIIAAEEIPTATDGDWKFTQEYEYIHGDKSAFDFAWIRKKVGIELQGGIYGYGGHNSVSGLERDYRKYNLAQCYGWTVLQFSAAMLRNRVYVASIVRHALKIEVEL